MIFNNYGGNRGGGGINKIKIKMKPKKKGRELWGGGGRKIIVMNLRTPRSQSCFDKDTIRLHYYKVLLKLK